MTIEEQKELVGRISDILTKADDLWKQDNRSEAYIVGYLEGALKGIRIQLEVDIKSRDDDE